MVNYNTTRETQKVMCCYNEWKDLISMMEMHTTREIQKAMYYTVVNINANWGNTIESYGDKDNESRKTQ